MDVYARRPQVQERLTTQIADSLMEILEPRGVIVVVECEHMCMTMRGVRKPGAKTITSAVRGQLRDAATRAEAMSLIIRSPVSSPARCPAPLRGALLRQVVARNVSAVGSSRFHVVKLWPPLGRMIDETCMGGRTAWMKAMVDR